MRGILTVAFSTISLLLFTFTFPSLTRAQACGGVIGLGGVSAMTGVPFQAEIQQTFYSRSTSSAVSTVLNRTTTQQVARDGQGRIRVVRTAGKFKVEAGADEGSEQERQIITICDPVKDQWATLDTISKTATLQGKNTLSGALLARVGSTPGNFCSQQLERASRLHNVQVEELGQRSIEGMDARGIREKRSMPAVSSSGDTTQVMVTEVWCADELGAIVLRNNGTEAKGPTMTTAMTNIQRGEPDAALFHIPADYRVMERVREPGVRQGIVVVDGFGNTILPDQTPAPAKP